MKLVDVILIALCLASFCIGVNEVMTTEAETVTGSIMANYWLFMLSFIFLIGLRMVRQRRKQKNALVSTGPVSNVETKSKSVSNEMNTPKKKKRKKR